MNPLLHLRPGDILTLGAGSLLVFFLAHALWTGDTPRKAIVRAGGRIVAEVPLDGHRRILAEGPLGISVIEIRDGRARVAADPSPRQHCVRQGWLAQAGDAALCLPNEVSVELVGAARRFDSLTY